MRTGLQKPNRSMLLAIWRICLLECVRALRAYGRSVSTAKLSICISSPICPERRSLTLRVSSSIAIMRQHRMDRRLLNPKIVRRALFGIENGPQTWITQGFGCNRHPPVLAVRPITSMTGAVRPITSRDRREVRSLQPYLDPQGSGRVGHPPVTPPRDGITSVTPSAFESPKPDRYHSLSTPRSIASPEHGLSTHGAC